MSRAFVKEDDSGEPPIIPNRAALPPGVTNYVTPTGLQELKKEREELDKERGQLSAKDDGESRRELQIVNGKLEQLNARISSARVIQPSEQPRDEVRFGATVKLENTENGDERIFKIVGVDEANVKEGKIAFVAPIAKVLNGKNEGDIVTFRFGGDEEKLKITEIVYE
ncbi:GreA/GreB family elongation factor [Halocola ammonii]